MGESEIIDDHDDSVRIGLESPFLHVCNTLGYEILGAGKCCGFYDLTATLESRSYDHDSLYSRLQRKWRISGSFVIDDIYFFVDDRFVLLSSNAAMRRRGQQTCREQNGPYDRFYLILRIVNWSLAQSGETRQATRSLICLESWAHSGIGSSRWEIGPSGRPPSPPSEEARFR